MVPLAVSSEECVEALALAGFRILRRTEDETVLGETTMPLIVVPHTTVLDAALVERILRAAGLSVSQFLELLSEPTIVRRSASFRTGMRRRFSRSTAGARRAG